MTLPTRGFVFAAVICLASSVYAGTVVHELDWHYQGASPVGGKESPNASQGSQFDTSWLTMTYEDLGGANSDKVKLTIQANEIGWYPDDNPSMRVEKIWLNVDDNSALKNSLGGLDTTPAFTEDGVGTPTLAVNADGFDSGGAGADFDIEVTFSNGDLDGNNYISIILDHSSLDLNATDFNENEHIDGTACYTAAQLKKKYNGNAYYLKIAADFTDVSTGGTAAVPEPGSMLVWGLGLGIAGLFAHRRRRNAVKAA